ncbi:MAG: hypothetical protein Kow0031_17850 [Anaerolineae bacterium]
MVKTKLWQKVIAAVIIGAGTVTGLSGAALADSPTVSVAAPSHNQGDMGAALGDVIDGSSMSEIKWLQPNASGQTQSYSVSSVPANTYGTALRGVTPNGSDLATAFYVNSNVSIPGNVYKYLVYRSWVANHKPGEAGNGFTNGRILYSSSWGSNWFFEAFPYRRYSKAYGMCAYGGWCTYFFDLTQNLNGPGSPNPWDWGQPGARVEAFGIWPHENWATGGGAPSGDSPDEFYIDYLYLTGDIVSLNDQYTIRWQVGDRDGGTIVTNLYYQERDELLLPTQSPACNAGNIGTWSLIASNADSITLSATPSGPFRVYLPIIIKQPASQNGFADGVPGPSNQSYIWDMSNDVTFVPGKVYYVCAEVVDPQNNRSYAVSSAPVIKTPDFTTFP